jgi:hypothetical protein
MGVKISNFHFATLPLPYKNDEPVTQSPGWFSRILAALNPFS